MKRCYFDHAAATPVLPAVISAMEPYWSQQFANASAIHSEGVEAKNALEGARKRIADTLGVTPETCIFTSSTTESVQLALVGAVHAWKKQHEGERPEIIISSIEHDAVLETARVLESEGVLVHRLPVTSDGIVAFEELMPLITMQTVLVSVMLVNNEVGTVQPIADVAHVVRKWKREVRGVQRDRTPAPEDMYPLLHTDATQAVNYYELNIPQLGVDMLSCNSSKIYGPKGIGLLYRSMNTVLLPMLVGGGQEFALRAGTEPVMLAVGFAEAFVHAQHTATTESVRLMPLRMQLFTACVEAGKKHNIEMFVNGEPEYERVPNNVNVSFANTDHEYLAILLDKEGFAVATKSACNEREAEESHVLHAIAQAKDSSPGQPLSALRLTLGRVTTEEEVKLLGEAIARVLPLAHVNE
jgi:cysteine desulfurase